MIFVLYCLDASREVNNARDHTPPYLPSVVRMRQKVVPEKKRSWLGNFGSGVGSGAKMVENAIKQVVDTGANIAKKKKLLAPVPKKKKVEEFANVKSFKKRSFRYKSGTVALREIKRAQSNHGLNGASVASLDVLIRDIASKIETSTSKGGEAMRFQPKALAALREAAEQFYTDTLRLGNTLSIHRGKKTLQGKDFALASSLMLAPHVLQEPHGSKRLLSGVLHVMRRSSVDVVGNDKQHIKGRADTSSEKVKTLRKYTQETGYDAVSDPPGIDVEEKEAEDVDPEADPDATEAEADSDDEADDADDADADMEEDEA